MSVCTVCILDWTCQSRGFGWIYQNIRTLRTQGKIPWINWGFVHSARELTFYCRLYCQFCFGTQGSVRRQITHLGTVQRLRSVLAINSNDTVLGPRRRCPNVHEYFSFLLTKQKDLWKCFAQISGKACLVLTGGRWVCIPAYFCWLSHGQKLKGQVNKYIYRIHFCNFFEMYRQNLSLLRL